MTVLKLDVEIEGVVKWRYYLAQTWVVVLMLELLVTARPHQGLVVGLAKIVVCKTITARIERLVMWPREFSHH